MNFINTAISLDQLPAAEELVLQPVQPGYKKVLRMEWLITMLFLLAVAVVLLVAVPLFQQTSGQIVLTMAVLLVGSVYFLSIEKSFPFLAFAVREKDIILQSGWIIRSTKLCPFNRIQNCSVQSGPLERRHRLASLLIYTAGAPNADIRVPGLLQHEADQLRHFILEKIHTVPNADS